MEANYNRLCPKCVALNDNITSNLMKTLSEWYLGLYTSEKGIFHVGYRCSCNKCGFFYEYRFSKNIVKQFLNTEQHEKTYPRLDD
jgi:hypothetical protein